MNWLLKTEPGTYSLDDLKRDKKTIWNGITSNAALKNLRAMKKGELAFIYHTGDERQIVGIAEITRASYPDPASDDEKLVAIDIKFKSILDRPISLNEIKSDKLFKDWDLLRIGRLSVVPTPDNLWNRVIELSRQAHHE